MKIKLSLCAMLVSNVLATGVLAVAMEPARYSVLPDVEYTAVIFKLKNVAPTTAKKIKNEPGVSIRQIKNSIAKTGLDIRPVFGGTSYQLGIEAVPEKYNLQKYFQIELPEKERNNPVYINELMSKINLSGEVELSYPQPQIISAAIIPEHLQPRAGLAVTELAMSNSAIPDLTDWQYYLRSPENKKAGYKLGGINSPYAWQISGGRGEGITIISKEISAWSSEHLDLPKRTIAFGSVSEDNHDTMSVGIMAAKDNGFGMTGIANKASFGYAGFPADNFDQIYSYLKPGDVVQIGIQWTSGGEVTGCREDCYTPMENYPAWFDAIKSLTDKGVHVIQAAGNGNINLDHPGFEGWYDRSRHDSGSIMVGAVCADKAKRASFSNYGTRIDSSSWGCWDVATTGLERGDLFAAHNANYTSSYAGTSSANPIVAGATASLSGIAKAFNIKTTPAAMRKLLTETGTRFIDESAPIIGTQPDLRKAADTLLSDAGENVDLAVAHAGQNAQHVRGSGPVVSVLNGSASENAVKYLWEIVHGEFGLKYPDQVKAQAVIPAGALGETVYRLTVTDKNGKQSTDKVTIKSVEALATIEGKLVSDIGTPLALTATSNFKGNSSQPLEYLWTVKDAKGNMVKQGTRKTLSLNKNGKLPAGTYSVSLSVSTALLGRSASASTTVNLTSSDQTPIERLNIHLNADDIGERVSYFSMLMLDGGPAPKDISVSWELPSQAEDIFGLNSIMPIFIVAKKDKVQHLLLKATVKSGKIERVITTNFTVAAK